MGNSCGGGTGPKVDANTKEKVDAQDRQRRRSVSFDIGVAEEDILKSKAPISGKWRRNSTEGVALYNMAERFSTIHAPIGLDNLDPVALLGLGSYARVRLMKHKTTGKCYALKVMNRGLILRLKQVDHVKSERFLLEYMRHPLLQRLVCVFLDQDDLFLLTEAYMGGDFFTRLCQHANETDRSNLDTESARFYTACVTSALEYMHSRGIVYRDLKPENLLLDDKGYLVVCDLGFAKLIGLDGRTMTRCGTAEYAAPEIMMRHLTDGKGYSFPADWWSLGILVFEMLRGVAPFQGDDP